jgi:hypothetical protein
MKRAVLSRGRPRTKVGARHLPKLVPAARTLGTARSPAYAHGQIHYPRHALDQRERASIARRPPQACLHHRTDGNRQDRTAYQSDARRPAWRRGLLPSRPAWRREQRDRRRDAARAHEGRHLSRSIRSHAHFRLQSPIELAENERATATANITSAFKNIWSQSWGPRLEYILTNSLRLLLDAKDQSLLAGSRASSSTIRIANGCSAAAAIR